MFLSNETYTETNQIDTAEKSVVNLGTFACFILFGLRTGTDSSSSKFY